LTNATFPCDQLNVNVAIVAHFKSDLASKTWIDFGSSQMNTNAEASETTSAFNETHQIIRQ